MPKVEAPEYRDHPSSGHAAATLSPNQAREAVKLGTMRYVLGISIFATIVAFGVAFLIIRG